MSVLQASYWSEPLAQDGTIVAEVDRDTQDRYWFFFNTGFTALSDGTLLAAGAMLIVGKDTVGADGSRACTIVVSRSVDGGATWNVVSRLLFNRKLEVALYARGTTAYLFASPHGRDGILWAMASEDRGATWSDPVAVIENKASHPAEAKTNRQDEAWELPVEASAQGDRWLCSNQMAAVERDGQLYMCVGERGQTIAVAACDLGLGVLNPKAWRVSDNVGITIPDELNRGIFPGPSMRCAEGNVVLVRDRLRVLARACIDRYATANLAAVFDLDDDGDKPRLTFTQFYPLPGGQCKFFIVHDEPSQLYWMSSNLPANTQGWVDSPPGAPLGNDRRFLMLWYSCDALNWFPAGCIARTKHLTESFMYPVMHVDGDDLLLLVRTSTRYTGPQASTRAVNGFHDANLMTFHRIQSFRSLAMDIRPQL